MFGSVNYINMVLMAELLLANHLFAHFFAHKNKYFLRIIISSIVCITLAFFIPVVNNFGYGIFMYLSILALSIIGMYACYDAAFWNILFCSIAGYAVQHLASVIDTILILSLFNESSLYNNGYPRIIIEFITLIVTYVICYLVFSRIMKKNVDISIGNRNLLLLSTLIILINIVLSSASYFISKSEYNVSYLMIIYLYNGFSCVFALCIQFGLLSQKRLKNELATVNQLLYQQRKQYNISKNNIDLINIKCHDLRYQIRELRHQNGEIDKSALKEIEEAINIYDSVVKTGNDALDIILTEKSLLCEKENIKLTCIADGETIYFISPTDLYSLFGNAIDNAIEAVLKISDQNKRSISLYVKVVGKLLSIHMENYYCGELSLVNGLPQTNKKDKNYHGFGMKSIRMIVEKYNGALSVNTQQEIFHLNIIISLP